ncbi:cullin-2 [Hyalella azteca]|uniref:Cullin-2 n=2 Tax=Hyalella azteca TaxID=294128 RepID=A0A8B7N4G5_HYAAZ|nr:cullin-2 [Hyalella azteca]
MSLKPKEVNFDVTWKKLSITIKNVLQMDPVRHDVWTECFSDVYSLCVAFPESLAEKLYDEVKQLLSDHVANLYNQVSAAGEESILIIYHTHWMQFNKGAKYLDSLFSYLNVQHIQKQRFSEADQKYGHITMDINEQHMEIGELAFEIWKEEFIKLLKERLVLVLLSCIKADRLNKGLVAPVHIVKGVILSFVEVCNFKKKNTYVLYESVFEELLLQQTAEFYRGESIALLQELTPSQYMTRVIARKEEEKMRCAKFLPPSCHVKLEKKVHVELVEKHMTMLHGECGKLVAGERVEDLANMYVLLKPIKDALKPLVSCIQEHIKQQGLQAVHQLSGENMATQFVENLLAVHAKYSGLVAEMFNRDHQFQEALHRAFESVVNSKMSRNFPKSPEIIAKYCDTLLKKSTKGLSEGEVDDKLTHCITIFKYVEDKDVFQKFYSRHLAKRLIHQQSVSMDLEESMINKLKSACGYEFTSKLHRMFTDMTLSESQNQKFSEFLKDNKLSLDTNFAINILQAGAWPLGTTSLGFSMALPLELEKPLQYFEKFYHSSFNGRKLTWLHHLSQGELKCCFTSRTYIITMVSYHVVIMLLFQKTDSMKLSELTEATKFTSDGFSRFLQPLLDSKLLVTDSKELTDDSVISLNLKYSNKRFKFRIAMAQVKEQQQQEVAAAHSSVEEDRKMYLQAAIVRIMKTRKLARHTDLVQEVISQSKGRFAPQVPMIKKCIELLLDKQYIERSNSNHDEYKYVA